MLVRTALAFTAVTATLALSACGNSASTDANQTASAAPLSTAGAALPPDRELARRVGVAFRVRLRELAAASGAAGETGDIGQLIPTGAVDRVNCRSTRCVVRWADVLGHRRRTVYAVAAAARECFEATARPSLGNIRDIPNGAITLHPLQDIAGSEPC